LVWWVRAARPRRTFATMSFAGARRRVSGRRSSVMPTHVDRFGERGDGVEACVAEPAVRELREPALDKIQPRRRCRREVQSGLDRVIANVRPDDKAAVITELRESGEVVANSATCARSTSRRCAYPRPAHEDRHGRPRPIRRRCRCPHPPTHRREPAMAKPASRAPTSSPTERTPPAHARRTLRRPAVNIGESAGRTAPRSLSHPRPKRQLN
jgi:hypothetical protein